MSDGKAGYPRALEAEPKRRISFLGVVASVVSILVLSAVLWPVSTNDSHSGRGVRCISNLKQIITAASLYASDNNEEVPFGRGIAMVASSKRLPVYEELFALYLKNSDVHRCIEDFDAKESPVEGKSWFEAYGSSYHYRPVESQLSWFGQATDASRTVFIHEADIFHKRASKPGRTVAYYDGSAKFVSEDEIFGNGHKLNK